MALEQARNYFARCRNADDYLTLIDHFLRTGAWTGAEVAAKLLSLTGPHANVDFVQVENMDAFRDRGYVSADVAFDQIAVLHMQVLYYIDGGDYETAYRSHAQIMSVFNKEVLQKRKEENWFMPILYTLCSDLRRIALLVDSQRAEDDDVDASTASSYYEKCANLIMESYRTCVADSRGDPSCTKKIAILNMTNNLFRIYFKINKLNLLKPLIRAIENSGALYEVFSMADKVTYNYFLGRKAMFDSELSVSEKALSYAFLHCPSEAEANKRRILTYLVPVKMFLGHMPKPTLLRKYHLEHFEPAVKQGNLANLDAALERHQDLFIEAGIYLMLEKLRSITYRTLFKKVAQILKTPQIPLDAFSVVLRYLGINDVDEDELACIVANLISQNKIKGYISHQHQKLVISKKAPFPPLSSVQS